MREHDSHDDSLYYPNTTRGQQPIRHPGCIVESSFDPTLIGVQKGFVLGQTLARLHLTQIVLMKCQSYPLEDQYRNS